ncbi:MAG: hypothetical protein HZB91_10155 [Elusimicrobia bacterium]|nr:hypothetical protein [Elusimicrobiota bacterium]
MTKYPSCVTLGAVAALLLSVPAFAQTGDSPFTPLMIKAAKQDPKYFTIDESSIKVSPVGPAVEMKKEDPPPQEPPPADAAVDIDQIINIVEKIWAIIEKNKPVVNIKTQYATAVPKGIDHWTQLESWKMPIGNVYHIVAKNAYGSKMVDVKFQVLRTYGGKYKGKGQYLTGVTVEPLKAEASWGYSLDLTAEVPDSSVINVGTTEDPLAGMMVTLTMRVRTVIKDSTVKMLYYLEGNGSLKEIGGPFDFGMKDKVTKAIERASETAHFE